MDKLKALIFFAKNYHGAAGGYQFSILCEMIVSDKTMYTKDEVQNIINLCEQY